MSPGVAWLVAAIILLIIEVFTGTFFIIWVAISAFVAGVFAFFSPQWIPWVVFVVSSVVLLWVTRPLVRRLHERLPYRTNVDALIGQTGYVTETIDPVSNTGRVRIGSDEWRGRADQIIEIGAQVRVVSISGATLTVEPVAHRHEEK
jgi:membrane protein implicated in regulation of membrane protease activity